MPMTKLSVEDLPPDQLKSWSLRVLAELAGLTQDQRRRVLDHALRVNRL